MELAGREWLWTSDVLPWAVPTPGASYVETADSGGFDECFPTVGACRIPGWVKSYGGVELPDHGELWSQAPDVSIGTAQDGQSVTAVWRGARFPYRFVRTVRVTPQGAVVFSYRVTNTGDERIPFVWSAHPLLPLTPDTRIILPEGARLRVFAQHGIHLGESRSEHRWPFVRGGAKAYDFIAPWDVARRYACKLFVDMPEGRAILREGSAELSVTFDEGDVTHMGLWFNREGWSPFKRAKPYCNFAFEPCIGAPDTLSEALGDWKSAQWLEAGAERAWTTTWRARSLTPMTGQKVVTG